MTRARSSTTACRWRSCSATTAATTWRGSSSTPAGPTRCASRPPAGVTTPPPRGSDPRDDRSLEALRRGLEDVFRRFGQSLLGRISVEDGRAVLGAVVAELPVGLGRIDVVPEDVEQLGVGDPPRVVLDLDRFGVTRGARRDLF